ncbi:carbon-nitrogen hydrolase family protein [Chitinibacteraceae bacterium HSL-7]
MQSISAAAVQMVSGPDVAGNLATAGRLIAEAGTDLIVLPEYFAIMGLGDRDKLAVAEDFGCGPIQDFLAEAAARAKCWLVAGTIPLRAQTEHKVRNSCLVFGPDGRCLARYDKIHLFGFDSGTERYAEADTIEAGQEVAVVDLPFGRLGLAVCYDLRFPELFRQDVDVWAIPAAFTATTGRAHWEVLLRARAIENQCFVVASGQGGVHPSGRETFGHSLIVDPWGKVVDQLASGEGVIRADLRASQLQRVRTALPALKHRVL